MRIAWPFLLSVAACGGGGGADGADGGDDDDAPPVHVDAAPNPDTDRAGCDGATLLGTSPDPAARGPWDVGARTLTIGRLKTEVWYPALPGSATGDAAIYDIRAALSPSMRDDIPDADNPWQPCDCERDLPLDDAHGPYPVVVFVHGTAAFRHQSLSLMTHWASRGFVVVAADHPGLMLGDLLANLCPDDPSGAQDLGGDVDAMLAALAAPTGELAFLDGAIDASRVAVTGHSAGGGAAAGAATRPGVRVVIPLAATQATGGAPDAVLYMGGMSDGIAQWSNVSGAYAQSAEPRALVGITNAGHLVFSDLCDTHNARGQDLVEIAEEHQLCGAQFASLLFDCSDSYLDGDVGRSIVTWSTTRTLESILQCRNDLPAMSEVVTHYADVGAYEQAP